MKKYKVGDKLYRWTIEGIEEHIIKQINGPYYSGPHDYMECITDKGSTHIENINSGCVPYKEIKWGTYYDTHKRSFFDSKIAAISDRRKYISECLTKLSITTKLYEDELKGDCLNNQEE